MTAALERAIIASAIWGPDGRRNMPALAAAVGNFQDDWARAVGRAVVHVLAKAEPDELTSWGELALAVHARLAATGDHQQADFHRLGFSDVPASGYSIAALAHLLELHAECVERRAQRAELIRSAESLDAAERRAAHAGRTSPVMAHA